MRRDTGGARSLDDVMRLLWQRYGRDFYRGKAHGLPENALPELVREATGVDVRRFVARYAYGTADVPLAELLAPHGIGLQSKPTVNIPSLDVRTRKQGDALALATVIEGGAAYKSGLAADDLLVDRKSTRLNPVTNAHLVCPLLLEQQKPKKNMQAH